MTQDEYLTTALEADFRDGTLVAAVAAIAGESSDDIDAAVLSEAARRLTEVNALEARQAELLEHLTAVLDAQNVQPYRGWNITGLNKAADEARAYLGLPSIRDLNPDVAKMQDAAAANKAAFREWQGGNRA